MAPPARRLYKVSRRTPSGNRYGGTTSRPPPEQSSERQAQRSGSLRRTSARTPSAKEGPRISSWRGWTYTPSAWWGGGGAAQCSATSTQQQRVSPNAYQKRCSKMAPTCSYRRITPANSAKRHSKALKAPFRRGFWRPGTGSV